MTPIEQIKERLNIVDVVSQYVKLKHAGKHHKGLSPFTSEKTPSFYVSSDRGLYHCFSTNKGGDIFTFVQEMEGLDFKGALKVLAERAGVSLKPVDPKKVEAKDRLFSLMEEVTKFFEVNLQRSGVASTYLTNRGLKPETIKSFRLGYVGSGWHSIQDYLKAKGFQDSEMEKAGLIKKGQKGFYDRFRNRIMFPILDSSSRVIAFSGRHFLEDENSASEIEKKAAKYLNSPDTELFNKSDVLYGIDKAKNLIRKYDFVMIVEGQMDLLSLHQAGLSNSVAVSGTALADSLTNETDQTNNLGLVHRLTHNLVLAYDSDRAGIAAAVRSARIALKLGMDTKIISLPEGKDPADFILEEGKDAFMERLKNAQHIVMFLFDYLQKTIPDKRKFGQAIVEKLLPELKRVQSAIDQSYFLDQISEKSGISKRALQKDLEKTSVDTENIKEEKSEEPVIEKKEDVSIYKELYSAYLRIQKPEFVKELELMEKILDEYSYKGFLQECAELYDSKKDELIFEHEISYPEILDVQNEIPKLLDNFKKILLKAHQTRLLKKLQKADNTGDEDEVKNITKEYERVSKALHKTQ